MKGSRQVLRSKGRNNKGQKGQDEPTISDRTNFEWAWI